MVSLSSIKNSLSAITNTAITPSSQDKLTEKSKYPSTVRCSRCSRPSCQCSFPHPVAKEEREMRSISNSKLLLSPKQDNNTKKSWMRGRLYEKRKKLSSGSGLELGCSGYNDRIHSSNAPTASTTSPLSLMRRQSRASGNGNSVPETHSEISAPLRHLHHEMHLNSAQLGPLGQVTGNGTHNELDDDDRPVNENCAMQTLTTTLSGRKQTDSENGFRGECRCINCEREMNSFRSKSFANHSPKFLRASESAVCGISIKKVMDIGFRVDKQMGAKIDRKRYGGSLASRQRYLWLSFAFLLFLSLFSSTSSSSLSFLDDDDDEFGGVSAFTHSVYPRSKRSAESFSILNDALSLIPSNYSIHEPPPTNNSEATQVDFSVLIMNVRDIKELNEELSLEMNLRIYWKDTRLSHLADRSGNKFIVLNPVLLDKIWHPDIFIDHVKGVSQPALISKPASLRIYPDSSVRYSARITVTMACQMDFHYYPADTQRCDVDMKSYAYSSKILALDWREGKGALLVEYLELPNFDVALDTTQNFMVNTSSGSYSGIRFTILLRRKLSYHLIQTYLPSTLFIIVSWLSFLVPPESVPGRMALCMTTLLTLTAMFSAVRQNTPNVSYVKALDIWMVVCIIFVFLTLVEYTVLLKLKSKKPKPRPPSAQTGTVSTTQPQDPQQTVTRWTIPSLQFSGDASNVKLRGCKSVEVVINENGTTAEMRHRENGNAAEAPNGGGGGDNENNSRHASARQQHIPTPPPPPPPPPPMHHSDRPLNKYELAAKKIEKFTSAVIPTLFVIFNFIYWPWLIESANYYNQKGTATIFKSM